jgi:phospholipid N-methyltransferase
MQARISRRTTYHPGTFLQEFLRHPRQVASITPSSRFLERRIVELADIASARTVVELGAGSGGTTSAILAAMPASARLLAIEINPRFCGLLRQIGDARLVVHCGGAHELRDALTQYELEAAEAIVSGIPFSTIDRDAASSIVEMIWAALAPGGRFVAYQVRSQVDRLAHSLLGTPHVEVEVRNLPPLRLYRWQKRDDGPTLQAEGLRGKTAHAELP